MPYAVAADVQRLIAQFTLGTELETVDAAAVLIIAEIEGEINAVLDSRGLVAPASTPNYFVDALRALSTYGSVAGILKSNFPDATGPGEQPAHAFWEARYRAGLKRLADGKAIPQSAATTSNVAIRSYFTDNPDDELTSDTLGAVAGGNLFSVNRNVREF